MRVCVTGAAGFIGSNLTAKLLQLGHEVTVVDDFSSGQPTPLFQSVVKSCRNYCPNGFCGSYSNSSSALIREYVEGYFDVVFHLAASARVTQSIEDPINTQHNNVTKTLELLERVKRGNAKRNKPTRFVFSSSSAIYGNSSWTKNGTGSNEKSSVVNPVSPYALQKLTSESYVTMYSNLYDFDGVSLRYFNVYGELQFAGSPYTTAIAAWLHAAKHDKTARFDGDGKQIRDMVHVSDVVEANVLAATATLTDERVFNVGTGFSVSNDYVFALIEETTGKALKKSCVPERAGDVRATRSDPHAAERVLNFKSKVDIKEGIAHTWEWAKNEERF